MNSRHQKCVRATFRRRLTDVGAQHENAVELPLLVDLVGVDGEALAADRLEVAAKAGIADECLVTLGELTPNAATIEARSAASFSAS